ncbi:multidrug efflux protein [Listeria riparia FSL S10-1204]|uniref:Probable multidrug resistance protein NorM n=1 Tax=Listeria riparia FSL S10-1204 TaxID=1265816 RepID=W7DAK1_9LIST|nr:multidrug efflux protein [Listeria riparia FSL S10-1204]
MEQTFTSGEKWRQFFVIFTPVVVSQLMLFSMALIDTMMSGHYSNEALAGTAIGNSLWGPFNASLSGLLMAVTPIISQLIGRGEGHDIKRTVSNGLYIAIGLAAVLIALNFFVRAFNTPNDGTRPCCSFYCKAFFKRDLFWDSGVFLLFGVARFH